MRPRGEAQRERAAAWLAWEREREHEGEDFNSQAFRRDILPLLQLVLLSAMMRATGLGLRYCSEVRRGMKVSHPMYWQSLIDIQGRQFLATGRQESNPNA